MIKRIHHPLLVYLSDVIGVALAWCGAYLIRFNFSVPAEFIPGFQLGLVIVIALQGGLLRAFGLYRSLWLFASLPDLLCIARAVVMSAVLTPLVVVVAVVFNTTRLQVMAQLDEIEISQMVGATDAFIHRPFYYTGAALGLSAGVLALATVALAAPTLPSEPASAARRASTDFSSFSALARAAAASAVACSRASSASATLALAGADLRFAAAGAA